MKGVPFYKYFHLRRVSFAKYNNRKRKRKVLILDIGILSLIGIIVGLVVLMYLAFKGLSLLIIGPILSLIVLVFSGMNLVDGMVGPYAESLGDFVGSNFLIFALASIFGSVLSDSGAADDIANAIIKLSDKTGRNKKFVVILLLSGITAVLTFGGVGGYVVVFTMIPFSKVLFKENNIPWHLFMAMLSLGGNLFTSVMIPGSPAIQNLIPMDYLGTTPMAASKLALIALVFSVVTAIVYIKWQLNKSERINENFMDTGEEINETIETDTIEVKQNGSLIKALLPIIMLLVTMNVFNMDPVAALAIGCVTCIVLYYNKFTGLSTSIGTGATNGTKTLLSVAAIVGFGGVVQTVPGFDYLISGLNNIPGPPLLQLAIATNVVAGIAGSASGGLGIALETLGPRYLAMGIDPSVIHRVSAVASYGLDSMPHGGSIVNQLNTAKLTHKQAYKHVFWISAITPFVASLLIAMVGTLGDTTQTMVLIGMTIAGVIILAGTFVGDKEQETVEVAS